MNDLNEFYTAWKENPCEDTWEALGKDLLKFTRRIVKDKFGNRYRQNEDCVSEALLKIYSGLETYDSTKSAFRTWVVNCILNRITDYIQDQMALNEVQLTDNHPYDHLVSIDDRLTLDKLVSKLSPERQRLIQLKLEGYENQEIGEMLGKTEKAIERMYAHCIEEMRDFKEVPYAGNDPLQVVESVGDGLVKVTTEGGKSFIMSGDEINYKKVPK